MLGGFWVAIDVALPDFLADATSGTVFYEDLADDYHTRADVNKGLLETYIELNVANGNLSTKTLAEYKKEGVKNKEVSDLLAIHFKSIDKTGYATFGAPYISMATSDRMTIAVLVHLLLDNREYEEEPFYLYNPDTDKIDTQPVKWNVLDMNGQMTLMEVDIFTVDGYEKFIASLGDLGPTVKTLFKTPDALKEFVLNIANGSDNPSPDLGQEAGLVPTLTYDLTESPIYLGFDGSALALIPSANSRGCLDYMNMAWLNSNGLLYAIVALFSLRKIFLIFAVWMIVSNFMIGLLRGMGKELKEKEEKVSKDNCQEQLGYDNYGYDNNNNNNYGYGNDQYAADPYANNAGYVNYSYGSGYNDYYYQQPVYGNNQLQAPNYNNGYEQEAPSKKNKKRK